MKTIHLPMNMKHLTAALILATTFFVAHANELADSFQNPTEETKPWCYWYWLRGDISKDGITKDLEAMAKVGIKRAMIGNIEGGGPVKMLSPEWYALTHHAFKEANRLSVDLMMFNAPGWSQSGGPWIKPEQSMRRVAWSDFPAIGGTFSQKVRPDGRDPSQDIAVLAVPRLAAVSLDGATASKAAGGGNAINLRKSSWIWHPAENAATAAPAGTRHFKREFQVDPTKLSAAHVKISADNGYALTLNGKPVLKDDTWETQEVASIKKLLKTGLNTIAVSVTNPELSPAGLIAAVRLVGSDGKVESIVTDASWQVSVNGSDEWKPAKTLGPMKMMPWALKDPAPAASAAFRFSGNQPFTARSLIVHGKGIGKLYALRNGKRELVADINATGGKANTDFLPNAVETFSFKDVTATEFELVPGFACRVELSSAPTVAQVIEKQMGRMHPTPSPTWQSYIFPDTVEPEDPATVVKQKSIIDLTEKLAADGVLTCTLPEGDWTIIHFGMITTGRKNAPAPPEATGLEVDKMSKAHTRHHFNASMGPLMKGMSPAERAAFKGITIDSYEVGSQNWTDGFPAEFEKRNGYKPILLLPVMTGRVVDGAKVSDQFLWDLRRTVADMIAENYVGGLREIAHENGLTVWCENYGHWGFPGEFLIYGGHTDEVGGEFWNSDRSLGTIECRAASSSGHIYGKRRIYAEAFTSSLKLGDHPYSIKARGEELFCEGINHFVLHVYAHQSADGVPGKNPWFGTAFHRNTPWFMQSRDWVKYLQRCHTMLQQGDPVADVAVYIGDFAPQMTGPANPVPAGHDYDYMGSDAILRKLDVMNGEWVVYDEHDPKRIASRYKLLALPEAGYIRPRVAQRLAELKAKGGRFVEGVPVSETALKESGIAPIVSNSSCALRWKARRLDDGMIFFLSNFAKTGNFEANLRVSGKVPELFNPVTGEITKLARYHSVDSGTRISIPIYDPADSCFIVFRDKPSSPSVVKVQLAGVDVPASGLRLFYDEKNDLTAESGKSGNYTLSMSDGTTRTLVVDKDSQTFSIEGPWKSTKQDEKGYSILQETTFELPADFGQGQRVILDLGQVQVMAKVKLNGKVYDTCWMPPFSMDVTDSLKAGENQAQILVTSTSTGQPKLGASIQLKTLAIGR
jgi:hypothetical protein